MIWAQEDQKVNDMLGLWFESYSGIHNVPSQKKNKTNQYNSNRMRADEVTLANM